MDFQVKIQGSNQQDISQGPTMVHPYIVPSLKYPHH